MKPAGPHLLTRFKKYIFVMLALAENNLLNAHLLISSVSPAKWVELHLRFPWVVLR